MGRHIDCRGEQFASMLEQLLKHGAYHVAQYGNGLCGSLAFQHGFVIMA